MLDRVINNRQAVKEKAGASSLALIVRNSVAILGARLTEVACGFISISLIARYLGVELFGLYGYVTSIIAILTVLSYFGIQRIIIREIAKDKSCVNKCMGAGIILRVILSIATLGIIYLASMLLDLEPEAITALLVFGLSEIIMSFISLFVSVFTALEKMHYDTLFTAVSRAINLALIGMVVYFDLGFSALFTVYLIGNLFSLGLALMFTFSRLGWPEFKIDFSFWKFLLRESLPLMLATSISKTFFRVDVFLLKFFKTLSDVSMFYGPHFLIIRLQVIPVTLSTVLFPSLARLAKHSPESLSNVFERAFKILISISLPLTLTAMVLADDFIVLYFGQDFAKAAIVFKILIWTINFMFLECLMVFLLISINKQWFPVYSNTVTLIVNIVLDVILIPKYGYVGASVATLIAYGARTFMTYYFVSTNISFAPLHKIIVRPILSALVMGAVIVLGSKFGSLYIGLVVSLPSYFAVLWLSNNYSTKDRISFNKTDKGINLKNTEM